MGCARTSQETSHKAGHPTRDREGAESQLPVRPSLGLLGILVVRVPFPSDKRRTAERGVKKANVTLFVVPIIIWPPCRSYQAAARVAVGQTMGDRYILLVRLLPLRHYKIGSLISSTD